MCVSFNQQSEQKRLNMYKIITVIQSSYKLCDSWRNIKLSNLSGSFAAKNFARKVTKSWKKGRERQDQSLIYCEIITWKLNTNSVSQTMKRLKQKQTNTETTGCWLVQLKVQRAPDHLFSLCQLRRCPSVCVSELFNVGGWVSAAVCSTSTVPDGVWRAGRPALWCGRQTTACLQLIIGFVLSFHWTQDFIMFARNPLISDRKMCKMWKMNQMSSWKCRKSNSKCYCSLGKLQILLWRRTPRSVVSLLWTTEEVYQEI